MLTVMCPNCRHRFPASGCCESEAVQKDNSFIHPTTCYYGGLLVPRGYTSGGGCFINAPTIVHSQPVVQPSNHPFTASDREKQNEKLVENFYQEQRKKDSLSLESSVAHNEIEKIQSSGCHITTSCDLTGGTVTITTPSVQSGGCLIQSTDSGVIMQSPPMEIRPKLTGGGCCMQKKLSTDNQETLIVVPDLTNREESVNHGTRMFLLPPSGCQELPGSRGTGLSRNIKEKLAVEVSGKENYKDRPILSSLQITSMPMLQVQQTEDSRRDKQRLEEQGNSNCCCNNVQNLYHVRSNGISTSESREPMLLDSNSGMQIQVNATVQLPANLGQCIVNITATTENSLASLQASNSRRRNNFNGGGLVQENEATNEEGNNEERRDRTPTTPVSWLMPCPWSFDSYLMDKDVATLCDVKRLLQCCGWYHEGLSWQQSENLLKNAAVGRWLMRDSSDSRYTFAVSVQTARGPTSVRVHYLLGRFRLDAEPRLAFAMPLFDCPIKMLEYYVEYSKSVDEHRKEVWVDYSGQLYSKIYLTKPLMKEIRSLSHLARLVINRCKLPTEHLPPMIKNYLAEYPYTL